MFPTVPKERTLTVERRTRGNSARARGQESQKESQEKIRKKAREKGWRLTCWI